MCCGCFSRSTKMRQAGFGLFLPGNNRLDAPASREKPVYLKNIYWMIRVQSSRAGRCHCTKRFNPFTPEILPRPCNLFPLNFKGFTIRHSKHRLILPLQIVSSSARYCFSRCPGIQSVNGRGLSYMSIVCSQNCGYGSVTIRSDTGIPQLWGKVAFY